MGWLMRWLMGLMWLMLVGGFNAKLKDVLVNQQFVDAGEIKKCSKPPTRMRLKEAFLQYWWWGWMGLMNGTFLEAIQKCPIETDWSLFLSLMMVDWQLIGGLVVAWWLIASWVSVGFMAEHTPTTQPVPTLKGFTKGCGVTTNEEKLTTNQRTSRVAWILLVHMNGIIRNNNQIITSNNWQGGDEW